MRIAFIAVLFLSWSLTSCVTRVEQPQGKGDSNLLLGNQYARDGLFREAADAYKKALTNAPEYPTTNRNLGMVLVKLGAYKEAVQHIEKAIPAYREDFDSNWYLGEAFRGLQQYQEAIFYYQAALKLSPKSNRALKSLAWSQYKIRYYSEALKNARALRRLEPNDPQTTLILARILIKLNQSDSALKVIVAAKQKAPKNSLSYLQSVEGDIHLTRGDCNAASQAYRQALESQPLLAGALLGYGRCFYRNNDADKALRYITRAVRIRPTLYEGYYYLGRIHEGKNPKMAAQYYRRFHSGASKDPQLRGMVQDMKKRYGELKKKL